MDLSVFATPEAWISLADADVFGGRAWAWTTSCSSSIRPTDRLALRSTSISDVGSALLGALVSRCIFLCFATLFGAYDRQPLFTLDPGPLYPWRGIRRSTSATWCCWLGGAYLHLQGHRRSLRDVLGLDRGKGRPRRTPRSPSSCTASALWPGGRHHHGYGPGVLHRLGHHRGGPGGPPHRHDHRGDACRYLDDGVHRHDFRLHQRSYRDEDLGTGVHYRYRLLLLALDGLGINSGIEVFDMHAEKLMVYFAMVFAVVLEVIQMRYNKNFQEWTAQKKLGSPACPWFQSAEHRHVAACRCPAPKLRS